MKILPQQIIPQLFGHTTHEKSAQTDRSKEMWVSISKGLKHLNTVLNTHVGPSVNHMWDFLDAFCLSAERVLPLESARFFVDLLSYPFIHECVSDQTCI